MAGVVWHSAALFVAFMIFKRMGQVTPARARELVGAGAKLIDVRSPVSSHPATCPAREHPAAGAGRPRGMLVRRRLRSSSTARAAPAARWPDRVDAPGVHPVFNLGR